MLGLFLLAALALLGIYLLMGKLATDPSSATWPRNPVAATAESRGIGKGLYGQWCAECHGQEGWGDGVRSREFPADTDLSSHVLAHPSGFLYQWITEGGGQGMPAFKDQFSDQERWHLVNFIRTFGESSLFGVHAH